MKERASGEIGRGQVVMAGLRPRQSVTHPLFPVCFGLSHCNLVTIATDLPSTLATGPEESLMAVKAGDAALLKD